MDETDWRASVKRLLRTEMVRRGMDYVDLADALLMVGVDESVANLRNKVARGRFSAVFLLQALTAIGVRRFEVPRPAQEKLPRSAYDARWDFS